MYQVYPPTVDQAERQAMMDHIAEHAPETREEVIAYAAYALAGCPDTVNRWLATTAAQDAIAALLADLDR
jgi:hypothetical protein